MKKKRNYYMRSGILFDESSDEACARIKSVSLGPDKKIVSADGSLQMQALIKNTDPEDPDDLKKREYELIDKDGTIIAYGHPRYAVVDDPEVNGWPINRLPKVDHADIHLKDDYILKMHNSQNYSLEDLQGNEVLRIMHKGIGGGWDIEEKKASRQRRSWDSSCSPDTSNRKMTSLSFKTKKE